MQVDKKRNSLIWKTELSVCVRLVTYDGDDL